MHLKQFIPHMLQFLSKLQQDGLLSDFHIYIMEQSDDGRKFNRGKLLNIGFDMAKKSKRGHDVFIFHDVDLLPDNDLVRNRKCLMVGGLRLFLALSYRILLFHLFFHTGGLVR